MPLTIGASGCTNEILDYIKSECELPSTKEIIDTIHGICSSFAKEHGIMPLKAIWRMDEPLFVIDGKRQCRFAEGDRLRVENGQMVSGESNARVIGCHGDIYSTVLRMTVCTDNNQWYLLKIK